MDHYQEALGASVEHACGEFLDYAILRDNFANGICRLGKKETDVAYHLSFVGGKAFSM